MNLVKSTKTWTRYIFLIFILAVTLSSINLIILSFGKKLEYKSSAVDSAVVTFIIPSKGRDSLNHTLNALKLQTDSSWKAIIIADGYNFSDSYISHWSSERIKFVYYPRIGTQNHAGALRNIGISHATTKWIGFVDDDDCLDIGYVSILKNEMLRINSDLIIFRMIWPDGRIIPKHRRTDYSKGDVGISFAMKRKIFEDGYKFVPDEFEDFELISLVDRKGYNVTLTEHILYYVKCFI